MILGLYHDGRSLNEIAGLKGAIEESYCIYGLQVQDRGFLFLPDRSAVLNAARLLKYLSMISSSQVSLWLVDDQLVYPGTGSVFGCSTGRSAILSRAGLDSKLLAKEALHEVGHLMGLDHCQEHCAMNLSESREEIGKKPSFLCPDCSALLQLRAAADY